MFFVIMDEKSKDTVTIFHLYRKDGSALFLHPFDNLERFLEAIKSTDIEGRYGREPRVESFTLFRNDLYRMIDAAVRHWAAEVRILPRLMICLSVLVAAYLILAFGFHSQLRAVYEVGASVAVALGAYLLLTRVDVRTEVIVRKTQALREKIDKIYFQEDPFVLEVEQALERGDSDTPTQILRSIMGLSDTPFSVDKEPEAMKLISYLEPRFSDREIKRQERLLSRVGSETPAATRIVENLTKWAEAKKVDLSLFVLYRQMRRSLKAVK